MSFHLDVMKIENEDFNCRWWFGIVLCVEFSPVYWSLFRGRPRIFWDESESWFTCWDFSLFTNSSSQFLSKPSLINTPQNPKNYLLPDLCTNWRPTWIIELLFPPPLIITKSRPTHRFVYTSFQNNFHSISRINILNILWILFIFFSGVI